MKKILVRKIVSECLASWIAVMQIKEKKCTTAKIAPTSKYAISVLLTRHCTSIYLARQFSARYSVLLVML